ncbi:MAG TPA: ATP-binding protein [Caldilineae bacterium]|nr:ATP-binding protein [Caldilineae bacterium]
MPSPVRELHFTADLANLAIVAEFVASGCERWRIDEDNCYDIQLAIDEAVTNIIEHAYGGGEGEIVLRCWVAEHHFYVKLQDWGKAFDPAKASLPTTTGPLAERKSGGLGIYFMRKLMDEVHFEFTGAGNILQMVKYNVAP